MLALGAAGAAAWAVTREPAPLTEEQEPNDDAQHANKIAVGTQVTGYLGKRRSASEGDRDEYVVMWPAGSKHVVTVRVTGIPNEDLSLAVADGDGMHGAMVDEGGVGEGEVMHRRAIDGPLVVTVAESVGKGERPIENVSDPYTLTVTDETSLGFESEPNGTDADANPLELTHELKGYLDSRDDVDVLRWAGDKGEYSVIVRAEGVPIAWKLSDGKMRTPGAAQVTLDKGELIRLERTDRGAARHALGDAMWSIVVTPAR
jgi:hypothetical protein